MGRQRVASDLGYEGPCLVQGKATEHDNDGDGEHISSRKTPKIRHNISLLSVLGGTGYEASAVSSMR
tara:strand:+ start:419 stop:619 length:201 start_codon:yes stop_codon:yes gene_type:complete